MRRQKITHEFVGLVPEQLEEGVVYVTVEYATAAHRCFCGCGNEVVTNFSPTDWKLIFDGETISLDPSVGNWSFPCQSHYWIQRNMVVWAARWTPEQIAAGRDNDQANKATYFGSVTSGQGLAHTEPRRRGWTRAWQWVTRRTVRRSNRRDGHSPNCE